MKTWTPLFYAFLAGANSVAIVLAVVTARAGAAAVCTVLFVITAAAAALTNEEA
jgi:hypothetical protein